MRRLYSPPRIGATLATNMRRRCPSFPAPTASARSCASSNAVSRWARARRNWLRCKSPIPMSMRSAPMRWRSIIAISSRNRRWSPRSKPRCALRRQAAWAAASLFLAGNYYWVQLDRDARLRVLPARRRRVSQMAPDTPSAQWRVAWTAVLKRQPETRRNCSRSICGDFRARRTLPTRSTGSAVWRRRREHRRSRAAITKS